MECLFASLLEFEGCLHELLSNLHDQQALAQLLNGADDLVIRLLSVSLATFTWLECQRNRVADTLGLSILSEEGYRGGR